MPRWLLPIVLGLMAAASGAVAWISPGGTDGDTDLRPALRAPVLSPRRAPELLSRLVADTRLRSTLQAALEDPSLGAGTRQSCLIVRQGRRPVFERSPADELIPASTRKVLTAHAVLARMGPAERLATEVKAARPVAPSGVVDGPLWLVGGGDPLLATPDYAASFRNQPQPFTSVNAIADAVVAAGVRHVRGGVLGDESRYDTQRYLPTWKPTYVATGQVGPASALVVNDGFADFQRRVPAPDPDVHAAAVLTGLLQARGVVVAAPPGQGMAPPRAVPVAGVRSLPMEELAAEMLRESDNLTAELLTKELGHRFAGAGTTQAGLKVISDTLAGAGLPVAQMVSTDGSGLDRSNRVTCGLLMSVLDANGPDSPLARGFPLAGRTGTLADRFLANPAAGRLRAKTGALEGVAGLVGYVETVSGQDRLAFALIANDLPSEAAGRALQERIGALLARFPDAPSPQMLAP